MLARKGRGLEKVAYCCWPRKGGAWRRWPTVVGQGREGPGEGGLLLLAREGRGLEKGGLLLLAREGRGLEKGGLLLLAREGRGLEKGGLLLLAREGRGLEKGGLLLLAREGRGLEKVAYCSSRITPSTERAGVPDTHTQVSGVIFIHKETEIT